MNVSIKRSQVWWEPFLKTARSTHGFNRFLIGSDKEYEKLVLHDLVSNHGWFFFGHIDDDQEPVAATAVSLVQDILQVHFYWTGHGHPESYPLFSKIFAAVFDQYEDRGFQYVLFPVPMEYLGSWHRYAEPQADQHGRRLDWYKFRKNDFAVFGKLPARHTNRSGNEFT